eukprot:CAMPEP_0172687184 /NCGR_PEP_ID=MMETSP1074-20121228/21490_1 /TAXON_ID=2916 /ORGANISM="Ceratium fusus, Strain PA161109" /LENGTH=45 /DNA_ID= /DNA_START= /DNA_END= /DNA_ORIENTATION=
MPPCHPQKAEHNNERQLDTQIMGNLQQHADDTITGKGEHCRNHCV